MHNFGLELIRLAGSFGIAGLIGPKSEVLYFSLFDTKHLGRTCDLLSAQLRPLGVDDFSFRSVFDFVVLASYRFHSALSGAVGPGRPQAAGKFTKSPLFIECGADSKKFALSVNFQIAPEVLVQWEGISERVASLKPSGDLEKFLVELQKFSYPMIFKYLPASRTAELVILLALPGQVDPKIIQKKPPFEFALLRYSQDQLGLEVEKYTHLGDLDYLKLLRRDEAKEGLRRPRIEFSLKAWLVRKISEWLKVKYPRVGKVDNKMNEQKNEVVLQELQVKSKELEVKSKEIESLKKKIEELEATRKARLVGTSLESADCAILRVLYTRLSNNIRDLEARNLTLEENLVSRGAP